MTSPVPQHHRHIPTMLSVRHVIICALFVVCFSTFTGSTSTWTSPNITQLGSSSKLPDVELWTYPNPINNYLLQVLPVNVSGTLVAFSTIFQSLGPVDIIVWRPDSLSNTSSFAVTWKLTISASSLLTEEFVYVEAKLVENCAVVQPGDWIGIFSTSKVYPIGYVFDSKKSIPFSSTSWNLPSSPGVSERANFAVDTNGLDWPLQFLFAAYILSDNSTTNDSQSSSGVFLRRCPSGLIIPSSIHVPPPTTTPLPIIGDTGSTGSTGATGATGQTGPTGLVGLKGESGFNGIRGVAGAQGEVGAPGPEGPASNDTGSQGDNGTTGYTGYTGSTGVSGAVGDTGQQGPPGVNLTLYLDQYGKYNLNLSKYLPTSAPNTESVLDPYWSQSIAVTAMYIWLAISSGVGLVSLVLVIVTCVFHKDVKYHVK